MQINNNQIDIYKSPNEEKFFIKGENNFVISEKEFFSVYQCLKIDWYEKNWSITIDSKDIQTIVKMFAAKVNKQLVIFDI